MEPTETPILAPIPPEQKRDDISYGGVLFSLSVAAAILYFTHRPRVPLLIGFAVFLGMSLCALPIYVIVGRWRKLVIEQVGIFFGGQILDLEIAGLRIRVNAIPLGGYVKFPQNSDPGTDDRIPPGLRTFDALRTWERITLSLAPLMVLLLIAMLLRGPQTACASFLHAFAQAFRAVCSPERVAPGLIKHYFHMTTTAPPSVVIGMVAAKLAAFNLIPVAGTNGCAVLEGIFADWGQKSHPALRRGYTFVVGAATLTILAAIGVAMWVYLFGEAAGAT